MRQAVVLGLFVLFFGGELAAKDAPRFTPLPEIAALAASEFNLDDQRSMAFLLSGVLPADLNRWQARFQPWFEELAAALPAGVSEEKRGEFVLEFLHGRHLRRYSTYQTRLDTLLAEGTFNCVSSAVAYLLLARSVGLDVQAVATTSHAFCLVRLADGREIDVETTNRHGFNPGSKTEFKDSFGETGFVYVPPGKYAERKTITDRGLFGLITQNRMAAWQSEGNPTACIGPSIDRWTMDPSPEARQTLVEGFVNLAAEENTRKNYLAGLSIAEVLWGYLGPVTEVRNLVSALLNNHLNTLLEKSDFSGAMVLATQWKNRDCLTQDQWNLVSGLIISARLVNDVTTLGWQDAAQNIETAFSQGAVTSARRLELLAVAVSREIQNRAKAGALAAWQFVDTLPEELRKQTTIARAREVYLYNWAVEVHNEFAKLWNQGKKDTAKTLLSQALVLQPNNAQLTRDWALVK